MLDKERVEQLIAFQKQNLGSMDMVKSMMGGGMVMEVTAGIARQLCLDTIEALEDYIKISGMKDMVDGD